MAAGHLSNDEFFGQLSGLFDVAREKDHGTVLLTQKSLTYGNDSSKSATDLTKPLPLIIRATNSKSKVNRDKKVKLSTIVEADALEGFFMRYAEVCKGGMSGLKKRDRSKAKEKSKAKKKKLGGAVGTEVKKA